MAEPLDELVVAFRVSSNPVRFEDRGELPTVRVVDIQPQRAHAAEVHGDLGVVQECGLDQIQLGAGFSRDRSSGGGGDGRHRPDAVNR